jgi:hypothetical protein
VSCPAHPPQHESWYLIRRELRPMTSVDASPLSHPRCVDGHGQPPLSIIAYLLSASSACVVKHLLPHACFWPSTLSECASDENPQIKMVSHAKEYLQWFPYNTASTNNRLSVFRGSHIALSPR